MILLNVNDWKIRGDDFVVGVVWKTWLNYKKGSWQLNLGIPAFRSFYNNYTNELKVWIYKILFDKLANVGSNLQFRFYIWFTVQFGVG